MFKVDIVPSSHFNGMGRNEDAAAAELSLLVDYFSSPRSTTSTEHLMLIGAVRGQLFVLYHIVPGASFGYV